MTKIKQFFAGRSGRLEFAALWFGGILGIKILPWVAAYLPSAYAAIILYCGGLLLIFAVMAGATIRRAHDLGRSGWFAWLVLVPFAGLYFLFARSVNEFASTKEPSGMFGSAQKAQPAPVAAADENDILNAMRG